GLQQHPGTESVEDDPGAPLRVEADDLEQYPGSGVRPPRVFGADETHRVVPSGPLFRIDIGRTGIGQRHGCPRSSGPYDLFSTTNRHSLSLPAVASSFPLPSGGAQPSTGASRSE